MTFERICSTLGNTCVVKTTSKLSLEYTDMAELLKIKREFEEFQKEYYYRNRYVLMIYITIYGYV